MSGPVIFLIVGVLVAAVIGLIVWLVKYQGKDKSCEEITRKDVDNLRREIYGDEIVDQKHVEGSFDTRKVGNDVVIATFQTVMRGLVFDNKWLFGRGSKYAGGEECEWVPILQTVQSSDSNARVGISTKGLGIHAITPGGGIRQLTLSNDIPATVTSLI